MNANSAPNTQEIEEFRATTGDTEQVGPIIGGFGVRVPGGAPASRPRQTSQSAPGPLCFPRILYASLSPRPSSNGRSSSLFCRVLGAAGRPHGALEASPGRFSSRDCASHHTALVWVATTGSPVAETSA